MSKGDVTSVENVLKNLNTPASIEAAICKLKQSERDQILALLLNYSGIK